MCYRRVVQKGGRMKTIKWSKIFRSDCRHCLQMLTMAKKWIMPDEKQSWSCMNCGNDYSCYGDANEDNGNTIIKIFRTGHADTKKVIIEHDNETGQWSIKEVV
jgi:hypothetical protein